MPSTTEEKHEMPTVPPSQQFPKNRLGIVFMGLMGCSFLAALDQTIVATALPTIVEHLGDGKNYSWVGTAYLLGSASLSPLWGKLSDILGRKIILYSSIAVFLIGSALCGAAQSLTWLIVCRAVQGIGGGALYQLVQIIIADIVPLQDRGKYNGYLGAAWGIASIIGPLVGGVFADHLTWRWIFFINLPFGGLAAMILFFFLNLNPHHSKPLREHIPEFDFLGLFLIVGGVVCVLIGFNNSGITWTSAETIVLLIVGACLLLLFGLNEIYTSRSPILPPRLFKAKIPAVILITNFMHALAFFSASYYLPVYFQVLGNSATNAGVRLLPFTLGAALIAVVSGQALSRSRHVTVYRIMVPSWAFITLGFGLMLQLDDRSTNAEREIYPLIAAIGVGNLFVAPLVGLQMVMPLKDLATSTGAFGFIRQLGGTIGISIGQAILSSTLRRKVSKIPGLMFDTSPAALSQGVRQLQNIPDIAQRDAVIHGYTQSVSEIWLALTPILGAGFVLVLVLLMMRPSGFKRMDFSPPAPTVNSSELEDQGEPDLEKGGDGSENYASSGRDPVKTSDEAVVSTLPAESAVEPAQAG